MNATASDFEAAARAMLGAKWRHRGRKPWAVDCVGLIVVAGQKVGLQFNDQKGYGREPWEDRLRLACRDHFGEPVADMQPGDVVLIRWKYGEPAHVGILGRHPLGGLTLIHAENLKGVVEVSLAGQYLARVVEVYRPRFE